MSTFRFRLQQLLEFRKQKEDGLKKELSHESVALEREEAKLEEMYGSLNTYFDEWEAGRQDVPRTGIDYQMHYRYAGHLETETRNQMVQIRRQEARVERARTVLMEASRDKKALERVKEKRLAAHKSQIDRRERAFLDDIAMRIHYDNKAAV